MQVSPTFVLSSILELSKEGHPKLPALIWDVCGWQSDSEETR